MSEHQNETGNGFVTRQEFSQAIRELGQELGSRIDQMSHDIRSVEKVSQPSFATMASWAGVIVMLAGTLGTGLFFYFNQRIDDSNKTRIENYNQVNTRIERLENLQDQALHDDLNRYKDELHRRSFDKDK